MGVSTNGILVFGFPAGDEDENPLAAIDVPYEDEDFPQIEDIVAAELGIIPPAKEYAGADKDKWHQYWEQKREAVKNYPVDLVSYCSGDYPMYILAVRGTEMTAYRGDTVTVDPASLVVPEEKVSALRDFCERYGIEFKEPKWLLCSMWSE